MKSRKNQKILIAGPFYNPIKFSLYGSLDRKILQLLKPFKKPKVFSIRGQFASYVHQFCKDYKFKTFFHKSFPLSHSRGWKKSIKSKLKKADRVIIVKDTSDEFLQYLVSLCRKSKKPYKVISFPNKHGVTRKIKPRKSR